MTCRQPGDIPPTRRANRPTERLAGHRGGADRWEVVQAAEFIHLLRGQLRDMTGRLAWLERHGGAGRNDRERAMRTEAAGLRRDIEEAQILIDRLHCRYLGTKTRRLD